MLPLLSTLYAIAVQPAGVLVADGVGVAGIGVGVAGTGVGVAGCGVGVADCGVDVGGGGLGDTDGLTIGDGFGQTSTGHTRCASATPPPSKRLSTSAKPEFGEGGARRAISADAMRALYAMVIPDGAKTMAGGQTVGAPGVAVGTGEGVGV